MELHVVSGGDDAVVCLSAEGDIMTQDFRPGDEDPFCRVLGDDCFSRKVLLRMDKATFIDSSGIGWLITLQKRFRENGGALVLHSIPPRVQQVFGFIRLDKIVLMAENEASALAKVTGATA